MRALIAGLFAIAAFYCNANESAEPPSKLEYKGIQFGATTADLLRAHPDFRCTADRENPDDTICTLMPRCHYLSRSSQSQCETEFFERNTYAGEPILMAMATFHLGALQSVSSKIRPRSYERIRDALAAKYGAADEIIEPITTNSGVTHENRLARWSLLDGVIRVRRMSSRIDEGLVALMSNTYLNLVQERKKAKAKIAPSDL